MNYIKLAHETLELIEIQLSITEGSYSSFDLATSQIDSLLRNNQYVLIRELQKELLANTPTHLFDIVEKYTKSLALVSLVFEYESDFTKISHEDVIKIKLTTSGRGGSKRSNGLLGICSSDLEQHLKNLSEERLVNIPIPQPFFEHDTYSKLYFLTQRIRGNDFPLLKSIMEHNVPASIVYFEY